MDEKKNSVLIVDDEKSGIIALSNILSPEYTLYTAKNGANAIKAAETYLPDLILLDILMPEMDGYDVISALKSSVKTKDIPVIFVTGLDETDAEEKGLALGAADYITKPFSSASVRFRVQNQLQLHKQQRITEYDIMKYKLANDALNIALWDMDVISGDPVNPNNKITFSQEFRLALGFNDEKEFPNVIQSWTDRLHPEDKQMTIDALAAHINDHTGKTPFDVEYRLKTKTGEYRHFHALGETMRDGSGVPLRTAGALEDITEKKQTAEALKDALAESNKTLEMMTSILNNSDAMIYVTDLGTDEILFINDGIKRHFKVDGNVIGEHCYNIFNENVNQRCDWCPCHRLDKEPDSEIIWEEHNTLTKRFYRNSDRYIDWPGGKKVHIQHSFDLTDIKQTQEMLKNRETMLNLLNKMAIVFLSQSKEKTFDEMMSSGISQFADLFEIDRFSLFRNFSMPDGLHSSQIYRWDMASGGNTPPTDFYADVTYAEFAPNWEHILGNGNVINGPARLMHDREAATLKAAGVISAFVLPIFIDNAFWGFALFEDRRNERHFDDEYAETMRSAGYLWASAVILAEMESEIAKANEHTKILLDSTPICCQLFNSDFEKIDCNQEAIRLFGFKDKQDFFERYHELYPEYQPDGQRTDEKVLSCLKKTVDEGSCSFNLMYRMLDGTPMPAEVTIVRVEHGDDYFLAGYTRDLREYNKMMAEIHETSVKLRKTTEKALESEERLQVILDAIPISVHLINRDCEIFDCNQEAVDFVGAANKADLLKRYDSIFPEFQPSGRRTAKLTKELLEKAFDEGWLRIEWMHQSLDDDPVPLPSELTLIRVRHKGEYIVAACSRDLREQKAYIEEMRRADIAEESNEAKSRFLATMSHEIRTPMNSIMGFAELALDNKEIDTAPQLKDYLVNIKESTKWLLKIINDILDISKIESGKLELESVPFDLKDIFARCQSVILPEAKEKGLELNVYVEPISGKRLLGDPLRLYQVLLNLLSNAVKFTNSGIIKFSSLVKKSEENNVTAYFEVKDSGIGMTSEQIDKIFELFMQAESNTTRNYGGTGLGLTITKTIVELMGGRLSVESSLGMGSTFSFEIVFNAIDASDDNAPDYAKLNMLEKPHFEGLILICDDNHMNQQVICEHLANVGFRTIVAENGKAGVEKVQERIRKNERPFDLIFMDIFMPVMDGIEAATTIAALNTGTPIVALTANIMGSELEKYKKHGMCDCLGKPFTSQELWHVLLKYLTPESVSTVDKRQLDVREEKLLRNLRLNFIKSNQTTYDDIKKAADEGDIKLAERIAHTLKGNAGQIGEQPLREAAAAAEDMLSGQNLLTDEQMDILHAELKLVLEKLAPMLSEAEMPTRAAITDEEQIREIFEKLEPMLTDHNPECMNMLDEIRSIPGTEELVRQLEDFEFKQAALILENIRNS